MKLPAGFTPLLYIESTGTQWADSGFVPDQDTRIVMDVELLIAKTATFFGVRQAYQKAAFSLFASSASTLRDDYGNVNAQIDFDMVGRHLIDKNRNVTTIDGWIRIEHATNSFTAPSTLFLLANNTNGAVDSNAKAVLRLYACKIYSKAVLVRDFVPCLNEDGKPGLYDQVENTFIGNSGSGEFAVGFPRRNLPKGFTRLLYLTSTGKQYLDLSIIPDQDTRVVLDIENTVDSRTTFFGARQGYQNDSFCLWASPEDRFRSDYADSVLSGSLAIFGRHVLDKNKNISCVDGKVVTHSYTEFSAGCSLYLLASDTGGEVDGNAKTIGNTYGAQVWQANLLVQYLVPCKTDSGEVGLYDEIGLTFYPGLGDEPLIAGPRNIIDTLTTDRTQEDVTRVQEVMGRILDGTATAEDLAEWNGAKMRGAYNYTDLNRVSDAMEYLRERLNGYGYNVPGYRRVTVRPVDNGRNPYTWYEDDTPTVENTTAYLNNVVALRKVLTVFKTTPAVPADMEDFTYQEANAIEQILLDMEVIINAFIPIMLRSAQPLVFSGFAVYPTHE